MNTKSKTALLFSILIFTLSSFENYGSSTHNDITFFNTIHNQENVGTWTKFNESSKEGKKLILQHNTIKNVCDKSKVWCSSQKASTSWGQIQPAPKASRKPMANTYKSGWKVPRPQSLNLSWGNGAKGKDTNYWLAYEEALAIIKNKEWYAPIAKWDAKQCSWGYGHKAPCGSKISKKQADIWLAQDTHMWLADVVRDFPDLHPEAQWALASFHHNCPAWYASVRKNGLKWFNSWCRIARDNNGDILTEYSKWLNNRRDYEWARIKKHL